MRVRAATSTAVAAALVAALGLPGAGCEDAVYLGPFTVELPGPGGIGYGSQLVELPGPPEGVEHAIDHRVRVDAAVWSEARQQRTVRLFLADARGGDAFPPLITEELVSLGPGAEKELAWDEEAYRAGELAISTAAGGPTYPERADAITHLLVGLETELEPGETARLEFTVRVERSTE